MPQYVHFIWLAALGAGVIGLAEWAFRQWKVPVEYTRNMVQSGLGLISLFFPLLFKNPWWVLLICALFQLILTRGLQMRKLKSVLTLRRKTFGTVLFPMVIYLLFLAWFYSGFKLENKSESYAYFYLPVMVLSLSDPLATYFGNHYPVHRFAFNRKTLGGLVAFGLITFFISCFVLFSSHLFAGKDYIRVSVFIATVAALTEFYTKNGFDNLTVPLVVLVSMYLVEYFL